MYSVTFHHLYNICTKYIKCLWMQKLSEMSVFWMESGDSRQSIWSKINFAAYLGKNIFHSLHLHHEITWNRSELGHIYLQWWLDVSRLSCFIFCIFILLLCCAASLVNRDLYQRNFLVKSKSDKNTSSEWKTTRSVLQALLLLLCLMEIHLIIWIIMIFSPLLTFLQPLFAWLEHLSLTTTEGHLVHVTQALWYSAERGCCTIQLHSLTASRQQFTKSLLIIITIIID